jgi:hypothetical protein
LEEIVRAPFDGGGCRALVIEEAALTSDAAPRRAVDGDIAGAADAEAAIDAAGGGDRDRPRVTPAVLVE